MSLATFSMNCPEVDLPPSLQCSDDCMFTYSDCHFHCNRDPACELECYASLDDCLKVCPCYDECPNGCTGCDSDYCICEDHESDPNFINCKHKSEDAYHTCAFNCPIDEMQCYSDCSRAYHTSLEKCPCQSNCPTGCPCPEYECDAVVTTTTTISTSATEPETTTSTTSLATTTLVTPHPNPTLLLMLNSYHSANKPILLDVNGREEDDFAFDNGGYETSGGCSLMIENEQYFFGGHNEATQILQLVECSLVKIGITPFNMDDGACTVSGDKMYLGFPRTETQRNHLYVASGPYDEYKRLAYSEFDHDHAQIAASDRNIIAPGGSTNQKVELFSTEDKEWRTVADYPKQSSKKSVIYHQNDFIVFGGSGGNDDIYSMPENGGTWTLRGHLNRGRLGHRSVVVDGRILVVGGGVIGEAAWTENCNLPVDNNEPIVCVDQTPDLLPSHYYTYPELFVVPDNYCK